MMQLPFEAILEARLSRRTLLGTGAAVGLAACARAPVADKPAHQEFVSIAPQRSDEFKIADGYRYNIVARWGDTIVTGEKDFDIGRLAKDDWLDDAAVAAQQRRFGTNCDAVAYFPRAEGRAARGLLCVNHEYINPELIFLGYRGSAAKLEERKAFMAKYPQAVAFMQAAHGVSVFAVERDSDGWQRDLGARENRRITANTPMELRGPARGHPLLRTKADPKGELVLGTFANCAGGKTPWGTYLTSEENVDDYFAGGKVVSDDPVLADAYRRFGLRPFSFHGWDSQDPRFDARHEPREALRFGWMVEIDPNDPASVPRKRTALGRLQREGANTLVAKDGRVVAYMGDDDKFEYVYKFVTRGRFDAKNLAANRDLLDEGTLYAARFDATGKGEWLPLVHDENGPLNSRAGFTSQGDVVIKARAAADLLGATPMDRPEDVEPNPVTGHIYVACTKTTERGNERTEVWNGRMLDTAPNAANPRAQNTSGHIVEIIEDGGDQCATRFTWNVFLLAGDPAAGRFLVDARDLAAGEVEGVDTYFAGYAHREHLSPIHCPDNLGVDPQGRLWIVTDTDDRSRPNNGCFVVPTTGPERGLLRQLASGPIGCEVCGCEFTPDGRTLFLSIQHPGEGGSLAAPRSHWPDGGDAPARASLLAIEREDGRTV